MLFRNQILTHVESSHNVRVLEVDTFNRCAWLFSLAQHNALPQAYALDCLEEALRKGTFIEFEATEPAVPRKYSQAAILRRNHAYAAIEPLIQNPAILNAATRGPLVRARAQELKCSEQTLYKYLRTWWHGGQSKQSLTPGFDRIGGTARGTQGNRSLIGVLLPLAFERNNSSHIHQGGACSDQGDSDQQQVEAA